MAPRRNPEFNYLADNFGIVLPEAVDFYDADLAMDAQPSLITTSNGGIPSFLVNYFDPKIVEILTAPLKATEILPEAKKGTWVDATAMFETAEYTGEATSYGDYQETGSAGLNTTFPQRQNYLAQTMTQWGELELERAGRGRIDLASRKQIASAKILEKFLNNSYFYGIAGLQNYGILNDPSLPAPITPGPKAWNGGNPGGWIVNNAQVATANEVFADIQNLVTSVNTQSVGDVTAESPFRLVLAPQSSGALNSVTQFNVSVMDMIKKNYPKLEVVVAPQYGSASNGGLLPSGNVAQIIATEVDGNPTGVCAFSEKLRAHRVVPGTSHFRQKKTCGTFGAIIWYPIAFASMVGV